MDDWQCVIFGKSYSDCFADFPVIHGELVNKLNKSITFRMFPSREDQPLDTLLRHERRWNVILRILQMLAAGGVGVGITKLVECIGG